MKRVGEHRKVFEPAAGRAGYPGPGVESGLEQTANLLLSSRLASHYLEVVDRKRIGVRILTRKRRRALALQSSDQILNEVDCARVDDPGRRQPSAHAIQDGVKQVSLAHAGRAAHQ